MGDDLTLHRFEQSRQRERQRGFPAPFAPTSAVNLTWVEVQVNVFGDGVAVTSDAELLRGEQHFGQTCLWSIFGLIPVWMRVISSSAVRYRSGTQIPSSLKSMSVLWNTSSGVPSATTTVFSEVRAGDLALLAAVADLPGVVGALETEHHHTVDHVDPPVRAVLHKAPSSHASAGARHPPRRPPAPRHRDRDWLLVRRAAAPPGAWRVHRRGRAFAFGRPTGA